VQRCKKFKLNNTPSRHSLISIFWYNILYSTQLFTYFTQGNSSVNLLKIRLLFLSFVIVSFCSASHAPSTLEFKQAVARYIKHTDIDCLQHAQRHIDDNVSYKKELRYLFKNYNSISTSALLSRLRSAHQEMVKIETDVASDTFKRYEQISSALLLICAQSFFYDTRNQILNALDEIDNLIIYWRSRQHHQLNYFFRKSPHKWIIGKPQAKEIANNIIKLERKQRELCTMLGALAGHAHALTTCDINYDDCYAWVNGLLAVVPYTSENSENVEFDVIANQLALRMKKMDVLQHDLLRSLAATRKPSHFVENWIVYTAMLAAAGYVAHYHVNNPNVIPTALRATQVEAGRLLNLSISPFKTIYDRINVAFSDTGKAKKSDLSAASAERPQQSVEFTEDDWKDVVTVLDELQGVDHQLDDAGKKIISNISKQLAKSVTTVREDGIKILQDATQGLTNASYPNIDIDTFKADLLLAKNNNPEAVARIHATVAELCKQAGLTGILLRLDLSKGDIYLQIAADFLEHLHEYTDIVDDNILNETVPLIDKGASLIIRLVELFGRKGIKLVQYAESQLQQAELKLQQAEKQLKDQELTLMFTALIPLFSTVGGAAYIYKWLTTKNYSPIRIALADVNALLIESGTQLNDYAYGKLLYLVFKLRNRADSLKDPLAHEFLADVAKLESKQYGSETKHSIVENMFNKYAFLGRIAS
jgi:hypothetical protein